MLIVLTAANTAVQRWNMRWDLTEDKRYTLSPQTKALLQGLREPVDITIWLDGPLNPSFIRLRNAACQMLDGLSRHATLSYRTAIPDSREAERIGLHPMVIHERQKQGQTVQTTLYPYATVRYAGRETTVSLLRNRRGLSGEENINQSVEQLEFCFAEALHTLSDPTTRRIAFIEGHGELDEQHVFDLMSELSRWFDVDRGVMTGNAEDLFHYDALVIAAPEKPFSEADKYQIDAYVRHGGTILWVLDGVQFSEDILSSDGFTPVIAKDLNLQDMLFRYGVRITSTLLQDQQCLPVPVNVSNDPAQPNFQPMPWYYAPLLLTSQASPITRNLGQVSALFCSAVEAVGEDDGLRKEVLLATSSASHLIAAPAEVDLSLSDDAERFTYAYLPVAMSVEGTFPSLFAHRLPPEGVKTVKAEQPQPAKQVVVACGAMIRNDVQQGKVLPLGYDRYTGMQFANKDFLVNAVLYLTDKDGLISLREREVALRLLNDKEAHRLSTHIQASTIAAPLILLFIAAFAVNTYRRKRYSKAKQNRL